MTLDEEKDRLRRNVHFMLSTIGPDQTQRAAKKITSLIVQMREFVTARTVAFYAATRGEVDTRDLFGLSLAAGKCCVFPRCLDDGRLEFARIDRWEQLEPGRFGLLEPPRSGSEFVAIAQIDLVLVPGLAFDREGGRLGRGGGFYDRTFAIVDRSRPILLGVAHSIQVFDSVPMADHDRRMSLLALESGLERIESFETTGP